MSPIPRRSLLKAAAVAGAAAQFSWALGAKNAQAAPPSRRRRRGPGDPGLAGGRRPRRRPRLHRRRALAQGHLPGGPDLRAHRRRRQGRAPCSPGRSPTGPTARSSGPRTPSSSGTGRLTLTAGTPAAPAEKVTVDKSGGTIDVTTGVITARIGKSGATLVKSVTRGSTEIARRTAGSSSSASPRSRTATRAPCKTERFDSAISEVDRRTGRPRPRRRPHRRQAPQGPPQPGCPSPSASTSTPAPTPSAWCTPSSTTATQEPGKAAATSSAGSASASACRCATRRTTGTSGIGGEGTGLLREAVKGITGLRRDPGAAVQAAQFAGEKLPDPATWDQRVTTRLQYIPEWGDYTLSQLSADGFTVRKRTKKGHGWIGAGGGRRASGFGYVGGVERRTRLRPAGLLAEAPRPARHPRRRTPTRPRSPSGSGRPRRQPMDLRFYHDGMGQDTYAEQLEGLNITYEDYEPGLRHPLRHRPHLRTPLLGQRRHPGRRAARRTGRPPYGCCPSSPPRPSSSSRPRSSVPASTPSPTAPRPPRRRSRTTSTSSSTYYKDQVEQRRWYGFWDYGDIMHTYDTDRHMWRYDVGGYAWDNSELSPDLWLWYAYLRTGRADIFRFAEAMTRHTGEVDVYHLGQWAGLGTRHGVQHYADSAKQQRIANTTYRRFYYFLTADERVGDLMHANVDSDETFLVLDPLRKIRTEPYTPDRHALSIGFGTDWSGLVSAWLTEWERKGPQVGEGQGARAVAPWRPSPPSPTASSRAAACTTSTPAGSPSPTSPMVGGLAPVRRLRPERALRRTDRPGRHAGVQRGLLRLLPLLQRHQGRTDGALRLRLRHPDPLPGPLTPRRVRRRPDRRRRNSPRGPGRSSTAPTATQESAPWKTEKVSGPATLVAGSEATWVSTNDTALYGLAAIENLALLGDRMP